MNTMELTKVVAGMCASLLAFLLISWAAEAMVLGGESHDGEHHHAYAIEMPEGEDHGEAEEDTGVFQISELMETGDPIAGAKVAKGCTSCHSLEDGGKKLGPFLFGVVGRSKASIEGFAYSGALTELGGSWSAQDLSEFLTSPKAYAPGTKMTKSLKKPQDRADVIAYLDSLDD